MKKRKVIYCAMIRGFYEFALAEDNSPKTFVMNELEIGKLYEVLATDIFTNRLYKTKDVFRVVGFEGNIPLIRFVYRKEQLINIGGASFSIDSILSVIKEFEKDLTIKVSDYAIGIENHSSRKRLVLMLEMENRKRRSNKYEKKLSDTLGEKLSTGNEEYDEMCKSGKIDKAIVKMINKQQYQKIRDIRTKKGIPIDNNKALRFVDYELLVS